MAIVYLITNLANGKRYVGKTIQTLGTRWKAHGCVAKQGRGNHLADAMRKHGADSFIIETIEVCESDADAMAAEKRWIVSLGTKVPDGYNLTDGGEGHAGHLHTEEWKRKRSEAMKASPPRDPEIGRKISAALKGRPSPKKGKPGPKRTEDAKRKTSESLMETHRKRREDGIVIVMSDEQKAKLSAAMTGRGHAHSEETKEKIRRASTGAVFSEERRAKIGDAKRGIPHTTETRARMVEAQRLRRAREESERQAS